MIVFLLTQDILGKLLIGLFIRGRVIWFCCKLVTVFVRTWFVGSSNKLRIRRWRSSLGCNLFVRSFLNSAVCMRVILLVLIGNRASIGHSWLILMPVSLEVLFKVFVERGGCANHGVNLRYHHVALRHEHDEVIHCLIVSLLRFLCSWTQVLHTALQIEGGHLA